MFGVLNFKKLSEKSVGSVADPLVPSNAPLPEITYMFPAESNAGAPPDIQIPPRQYPALVAFGVTLNTVGTAVRFAV
jgi:hypothetical protein